jgi:two-component system, cell cycle sensor histidine kinase and response regulator CckA
MLLALMERALCGAGYEVHSATNGLDALRLVARLPTKPDVLITDLCMEPIDGPNLARLVAEGHPRLPILFVGGYHEDLQRHPLPGPLLPKPFSPEQLVRAVEDLLTGPPAAIPLTEHS